MPWYIQPKRALKGESLKPYPTKEAAEAERKTLPDPDEYEVVKGP